MEAKDRERLALSTGIALAGYAVIYLLLAGLRWPPDVAVQSISAPVSVYVDLQGNSRAETPASPQLTPEKAPQSAQLTRTEAKPSSKQSTTASVAPPLAASSQTPTSTQPQLASAAQPTAPESSSPPRPPMPTSMTSSAGPTSPPSGGTETGSAVASRSGAPLSGSASPKPGVSYPPGENAEAAPPQGSGGTESQSSQGQSQTYYGPAASKSGSIFNPNLVASAGTSPPSSSTASGDGTPATSPSGGSGTPAAGQQPAGTAGGTVGSAGTASGSAPKIEWKGNSSSREVAHQPEPLVIPEQYLNEIPPSITLKIAFEVTPLGTVNALNVTPSLGYPELDNELETWMEKWRFQPITGNQVAQGTLQYVIRVDTAR